MAAKKKDNKDQFLSQKEINTLLKALGSKEDTSARREDTETRKIKIYDFRRPDIVGKRSIYLYTTIMEAFAQSATNYLQAEYGFKAKVNVVSVDQLTREEFIRCIPIPSFCTHSSWLGGTAILNFPPKTFLNGILGRQSEQKSQSAQSGVFEQKVFMQFFAERFFNEAYKAFNAKSQEPLPKFDGVNFESNIYFLPYTESFSEMGLLASLELVFDGNSKDGDATYPIDFFVNSTVVEELEKRKIICKDEKLRLIPLEKPLGNVVVELGRCRVPENFVFEKNQLLQLDALEQNPLSVFVDGQKKFLGTAVIIEDSLGVRLESDGEASDSNDSFYNVRVVYGSTNADSKELEDFGNGKIVELSESWNDYASVYVNNVLRAQGKIYTADGHFAIRIMEVM